MQEPSTPPSVTPAVGRGTTADRADWVRASGYDEHRHGPIDRHRLDAVVGDVAVRVQHRSGLGWVLSSAALRRSGCWTSRIGGRNGPPASSSAADGRLTGWLHRLDGWLGERVPPARGDLAEVSTSLAGHGITGVTDATHALDRARLATLRTPTRPASSAAPRAAGRRTTRTGAGAGPVWVRPSCWPTRCWASTPASWPNGSPQVHARRRPVAIHAVTRAENVAAVTALAEAGPFPGDRIEHGSVLPTDLDPLLVGGGVTVSSSRRSSPSGATTTCSRSRPATCRSSTGTAPCSPPGCGSASGATPR